MIELDPSKWLNNLCFFVDHLANAVHARNDNGDWISLTLTLAGQLPNRQTANWRSPRQVGRTFSSNSLKVAIVIGNFRPLRPRCGLTSAYGGRIGSHSAYGGGLESNLAYGRRSSKQWASRKAMVGRSMAVWKLRSRRLSQVLSYGAHRVSAMQDVRTHPLPW